MEENIIDSLLLNLEILKQELINQVGIIYWLSEWSLEKSSISSTFAECLSEIKCVNFEINDPNEEKFEKAGEEILELSGKWILNHSQSKNLPLLCNIIYLILRKFHFSPYLEINSMLFIAFFFFSSYCRAHWKRFGNKGGFNSFCW